MKKNVLSMPKILVVLIPFGSMHVGNAMFAALKSIKHVGGNIEQVECSPDGTKLVLVDTKKKEAVIHDATVCHESILETVPNSLFARFSSGGTYLAVVTDKKIILKKTATLELDQALDCYWSKDVAFNAQENRMAYAVENRVYLRDLITKTITEVYYLEPEFFSPTIRKIFYAPQQKIIVEQLDQSKNTRTYTVRDPAHNTSVHLGHHVFAKAQHGFAGIAQITCDGSACLIGHERSITIKPVDGQTIMLEPFQESNINESVTCKSLFARSKDSTIMATWSRVVRYERAAKPSVVLHHLFTLSSLGHKHTKLQLETPTKISACALSNNEQLACLVQDGGKITVLDVAESTRVQDPLKKPWCTMHLPTGDAQRLYTIARLITHAKGTTMCIADAASVYLFEYTKTLFKKPAVAYCNVIVQAGNHDELTR